ncbi:MAG: hypothetical protein IJ861_00190 [Clostridia bacterium]|nr:hypothetical protein [Clostridia bacterium]
MGRYDDIINLPAHQSTKHPPMSRMNRAAQFAPFAALTGYGAAITETGRLTDNQIELNDETAAVLNEKLRIIIESIKDHPHIEVIYFLPDTRKAGGKYVVSEGDVKSIDLYNRQITFTDKSSIPIDSISDIQIQSE